MTPLTPGSSAIPASALEVLLDIELPLTLRFGKTQLLLGELGEIETGSVIVFDRAPDEPVEILVNGKLVARGEVVMAGGNYAVRLTEVSSHRERMNSSTLPKEIQ